MNIKSIVKRENGLLFVITVYCSVCLYLFMRNMVFIDEYPNMPDWISTIGVTIAWIGITCIGLVCWLLILRDKRFIGLIAIVGYGALSFNGLGHYSLEPVSAHTYIVNLAIWIEVITVWVVLLIVTGFIVSNLNKQPKKPKLYKQKRINRVRLI